MRALWAGTRDRALELRPSIILPALGLLLLLVFGLGGAMQRDPSHIDMDVFYGAGTWYLEGVSPYGELRTPPRLEPLGIHMKAYGYAPHFAPFTIALATLDYRTARIAWTAVNLLAAAALAAVIVALMYDDPARVRTDPLAARVTAFLVLGSPFAATVMWLGNTSIIVAACLSAAWWLDRRKQPLAAGVLLALALIKPQFALLPLLWLVGERRWATLAVCAATCAVLFAYHAVTFGPVESIRDWIAGVMVYQATERPPGFEHIFGIAELVRAAGFPPPPVWLLAIPLVAAAWIWRQRQTALESLAILCAVAALLLPIRDYDLIILAPLVGAIAAQARGSLAASATALIAVVLLYLPQRTFRGFDSPIILQWRVLVVLLMLGYLAMLIARRAGVPGAAERLGLSSRA